MRLIQHSSAEKARPYRNTKVVPVPICCVSWHVCNVKKRYAKEMEKVIFISKKKKEEIFKVSNLECFNLCCCENTLQPLQITHSLTCCTWKPKF